MVRVTRSYQITIPAEVRRKLGIEIGDELTVRIEGDSMVVEKAGEELPTYKAGRRIDLKDIEEALMRGMAKAVAINDEGSD